MNPAQLEQMRDTFNKGIDDYIQKESAKERSTQPVMMYFKACDKLPVFQKTLKEPFQLKFKGQYLPRIAQVRDL